MIMAIKLGRSLCEHSDMLADLTGEAYASPVFFFARKINGTILTGEKAMNAPVLELEGTWEEVAAHAPELAGRRVRLTVLSVEEMKDNPETRFSTAGSLLKFAGTWEGDDLQQCLDLAYRTRGPAEFKPNLFNKNEE